MRSINAVTLTGGIPRDAEMKYTGGGMAIASFSIAVTDSRKVGDQWQDESYYFDCSLFGKRADALGSKLVKGTQLTITGKLRQEKWEKDGQKHSKVAIIVDDVVLHQRAASGQSTTRAQEYATPSDEEIPF